VLVPLFRRLKHCHDVGHAWCASRLALGVHQASVEPDITVLVADRHQGERVDGLVELREEPPGQRQGRLLEAVLDVVVDDDVDGRPLRDRDGHLAVADLDRVGHDPHVGVEDRLAGGDVVLPLVPRTTQDPAF
jgi:hypothetical protein